MVCSARPLDVDLSGETIDGMMVGCSPLARLPELISAESSMSTNTSNVRTGSHLSSSVRPNPAGAVCEERLNSEHFFQAIDQHFCIKWLAKKTRCPADHGLFSQVRLRTCQRRPTAAASWLRLELVIYAHARPTQERPTLRTEPTEAAILCDSPG